MLIAIPLLVVPVVIYNLVILLGGGGADPLLGPTADRLRLRCWARSCFAFP